MIGLLAVLPVVYHELKKLKFIMTVCGSDRQKGEGLSVITMLLTGSRTPAVVTVS
jgi:hypothetical protein